MLALSILLVPAFATLHAQTVRAPRRPSSVRRSDAATALDAAASGPDASADGADGRRSALDEARECLRRGDNGCAVIALHRFMGGDASLPQLPAEYCMHVFQAQREHPTAPRLAPREVRTCCWLWFRLAPEVCRDIRLPIEWQPRRPDDGPTDSMPTQPVG